MLKLNTVAFGLNETDVNGTGHKSGNIHNKILRFVIVNLTLSKRDFSKATLSVCKYCDGYSYNLQEPKAISSRLVEKQTTIYKR